MNRNVRLSDALMPVCGSGVETQGDSLANSTSAMTRPSLSP